MAVSGRELSSLDFGNLIGGPLNAIVEAQAKSAIATANFIKSVGFDKNNKVVNVDFTYNRKGETGGNEEFTLTLPFITMLPIPYISVSYAEIEFNAKITSVTEDKTDSNFEQVVNGSAGGSWWFASARVNSKTSYQKKSAHTDREERSFDMHVRVEARNVDMPPGTERILNMLENVIQERSNGSGTTIGLTITNAVANEATPANVDLTITGPDTAFMPKNFGFILDGVAYTGSTWAPDKKIITIAGAKDDTANLKGKIIALRPGMKAASTSEKVVTVDEVLNGVSEGTKLMSGKNTYLVKSADAAGKKITLDKVDGIAANTILVKA